MCGILGFVGANTPANLKLVEALLLQLSLRGTHATGISWLDEHSTVHTLKEPLPAKLFLSRKPFAGLKLNDLTLIAHTRYSTSDLAYNQPLLRDDTAIVMNGVISQEPPELWPMADWFDYKTRNDTEIALCHTLHGMRGQVPGSFACCELSPAGLVAYRNADRPLWLGRGTDCWVCASTQDALKRCGLTEIRPTTVGRIYDIDHNGIVAHPIGGVQRGPDHQTAAEYGDLHCRL